MAADNRLFSPQRLDAALRRIRYAARPVSEQPALVVESLPEDLELKVQVLTPLCRRWPKAVVASNTSSLDIDDLGRRIDAADRTLGAHYLNPPLLMPPVEVIAGSRTDPALVEWFMDIVTRQGHEPVLVRDPQPGFVWNRLQFALLREAVSLVESGCVSADEIDAIVEGGLARRWRAVGPFRTAALGGVGTFMRAAEPILPTLSDDPTLDGLASMIAPESYFEGTARRDRLLAEDIRLERGSLPRMNLFDNGGTA
jgi:3-hydroxybutyryl-CoA dehydrogenase